MVWRAAWGYLALVLLLAPMLGLMHGVVHAAAGSLHTAQAHHHDTDNHAHEHTEGHAWLAYLFSVHADDSDCRVYDQLCHSEVLSEPPALVLPVALSSFVFHFLEGEVLARWAALFGARGPPLTR